MIFFYYLLFCVYWGQKQNPHKKKKNQFCFKNYVNVFVTISANWQRRHSSVYNYN